MWEEEPGTISAPAVNPGLLYHTTLMCTFTRASPAWLSGLLKVGEVSPERVSVPLCNFWR